jgi:DNA-binding winged helix-turn-helix (wHTH) protein/predicted ATPase
MEKRESLEFPPFRLDVRGEQLWRGANVIALRPKTFAVLRYLVEHPNQLVTKDTLLDTVWAETVVGDTVLKSCIRELREVLGDDAQTPRFIATVHRRGYRFIGLEPLDSAATSDEAFTASAFTPEPSAHSSTVVGRSVELQQLQHWYRKALAGRRQIVFVTGEPGIGKTTLLDEFVRHFPASDEVWIERGQCIEHYGGGEAYLPVLTAFGRLCRKRGGERIVEILRKYAPTWLVQMPGLVSDAEVELLQRKVQGATRERMLREMAEALEIVTTDTPLVLILEDLQWSDYSSIDLVSYLAHQSGPARLLIIGAYRPVDVLVSGHPLKAVKQELQTRGRCEEVSLRLFTPVEIGQYLATHFPQHQFPPTLAEAVYQRTEGNPLFVANVMNEFVQRGAVRHIDGSWRLTVTLEELGAGSPQNLDQMIEQQIERLPPATQRVLEIASVAGVEFVTTGIAACGGLAGNEVEEQCAELARHGYFLQRTGLVDWPDGSIGSAYRFSHALYQEVLYRRLAPIHQVECHRRLGEWREHSHAERTEEIASELAMHFTRGRDYARALRYRLQAGHDAKQKSAYREAITHLTEGLHLLAHIPKGTEASQMELQLRAMLGSAFMAANGYASAEVKTEFDRALQLCRQLPQSSELFPVLFGLWGFHLVRGEYRQARDIAEELEHIAQRQADSGLLVEAYGALGVTLFYLGELQPAHRCFQKSLDQYDPARHSAHAAAYGQDPRVACLAWQSQVLWLLGEHERGWQDSHKAVQHARGLSHPFSEAFSLFVLALLSQFRGESAQCQAYAEENLHLCEGQEFPFWRGPADILLGWALCQRGNQKEGLQRLEEGISNRRTMGAVFPRPYFVALLGEAYSELGREQQAREAIASALATIETTGERWCEAEVYRLKGEMLLRSVAPARKTKTKSTSGATQRTTEAEAEMCFQKALEIARAQGATSWELRATLSLARLWRQHGKEAHACRLLQQALASFPNPEEQTRDLQEARLLLKRAQTSRVTK